MRDLASYVMRGPRQAAILATVATIIPMMFWLGAAAVALVVLRVGLARGLSVAVWPMLPAALWMYWANDPKTPFANRHAASLRAVYDLADLEKSQFIYQTGQSGLVFSTRYRDMSPEWAAVTYRPLMLRPAAYSHTLVLTP